MIQLESFYIFNFAPIFTSDLVKYVSHWRLSHKIVQDQGTPWNKANTNHTDLIS